MGESPSAAASAGDGSGPSVGGAATPPAPASGAGTPGATARLRAIQRGLFFIIGCGRSGTTLLRLALTQHPDIEVPRETKYYERFPGRLRYGGNAVTPGDWDAAVDAVWDDTRGRTGAPTRAVFDRFTAAADHTWDGLFVALMASYAEVAGAVRVGEKSPVHTHHLARLAESFPEARFIHLMRDPRAVVLSRMKARFGSRRLGLHVERWRRAVDAHRAHADRLGPDRYQLVRYEDLVSDLRGALEPICGMLGIELVPAMLEPHRRRAAGFDKDAAHMANTLKPVFTDSIERWRTELTPTQIALIDAALGDDMADFGYEPTGARALLGRPRVRLSEALGLFDAYRDRYLAAAWRRVTGTTRPDEQEPDVDDSEDPEDSVDSVDSKAPNGPAGPNGADER